MLDSDQALLDRQAALQAEAAAVLADLNVFGLIGAIGTPVQTGSSALGLMVVRDIDITTQCPSLDPATIFRAMGALAAHPRVPRLAFRNDTGRWNTDPRYADGLYWMVHYAAEDDQEWKLDLWFLRAGTTQFDLEHLKTLPARLTRDNRIAILRIKEDLAARPPDERVASYQVYEAVLDHGIRTPDEFRRHLAG